MKHIVFDTNILILFVRNPNVLDLIIEKYPQNQFTQAISVVTEGELKSLQFRIIGGFKNCKPLITCSVDF